MKSDFVFHYSNWSLCTASLLLRLATFEQGCCRTSREFDINGLLQFRVTGLFILLDDGVCGFLGW